MHANCLKQMYLIMSRTGDKFFYYHPIRRRFEETFCAEMLRAKQESCKVDLGLMPYSIGLTLRKNIKIKKVSLILEPYGVEI